MPFTSNLNSHRHASEKGKTKFETGTLVSVESTIFRLAEIHIVNSEFTNFPNRGLIQFIFKRKNILIPEMIKNIRLQEK